MNIVVAPIMWILKAIFGFYAWIFRPLLRFSWGKKLADFFLKIGDFVKRHKSIPILIAIFFVFGIIGMAVDGVSSAVRVHQNNSKENHWVETLEFEIPVNGEVDYSALTNTENYPVTFLHQMYFSKHLAPAVQLVKGIIATDSKKVQVAGNVYVDVLEDPIETYSKEDQAIFVLTTNKVTLSQNGVVLSVQYGNNTYQVYASNCYTIE